MPHQCVRCNKFYEDGSSEIISGCPCGARLFFYIKPEKYEEIKKRQERKLTKLESFQIEQDIFTMLGVEPDHPVVLDFEVVNVISPGKYEIDVVRLFQGKPLIFKVEEGKYVIDLPGTFAKMKDRQRR
jgi:predicted  nucleic acid-binding Zn-ribbon protein